MTLDQQAELEKLRRQEAALLSRLRRGDEKIAAARAQGEPVEKWETLWVELLASYCEVYDKRTAMEGA